MVIRQLDIRTRERIENKWFDKIPSINFKQNWNVKILPPTGGVIVRFRVIRKEDNSEVSVYLDCYDMLKHVGQPYWEVFSIKTGECLICFMNEADELINIIDYLLKNIRISLKNKKT